MTSDTITHVTLKCLNPKYGKFDVTLKHSSVSNGTMSVCYQGLEFGLLVSGPPAYGAFIKFGDTVKLKMKLIAWFDFT